MDCPTEEALIRKGLADFPGVGDLEFNLLQRHLTVEQQDAEAGARLQARLKKLGFEAKPLDAQRKAELPQRSFRGLILAGMVALGSEIAQWLHGPAWLVAGLALVALLLGGLTTYRKGWIALRNLNLNMNALTSLAVTGAMLIGHWPEAAMVMVLFVVAEVIEARSMDRARRAIRGLLDLAPERATVRQADGQWLEMEAKAVALGSRVRVRPGERIALDGVVREGHSTVNQAPITGESLPVEKGPGDPVFAGTVNESGSFEYEVQALADDSTLARIIHAVEEAQSRRAPTQRFVDAFARWYTPLVFLVAILVALVPPLLLHASWIEWIYRALILLVVACPCALVISTPVTLVSGLTAAARHGILVKGGVYLEKGCYLKWLALDKTGTLTQGKPELTDYVPQGEANAPLFAASLAARSDHPASKALVAGFHGQALLEVSEFEALPGQGIQGVIHGKPWQLGRFRADEAQDAALLQAMEALEAQGKSVVTLRDDEGVKALFAVADALKPHSREAIAELHGMGVKTVMLSGDNASTAQVIAAQVGMDGVKAPLLPGDKLREIEALAALGPVGMVGDGINDAPALARAEIGFAMGAAGSDAAIETADVALMDDNLRKIPLFLRLSRDTRRILTQNIALALGIKAIFLALTFTGHATMWMAVFADMGASLLVVGNGLRLLRR
ncbi:MAG: heavy metal translocating P-type ATPase [Firmicutes bacterium]|nr:heavy metal translocating P-type ATPase [Bacillota bacterium]